MDREEDTQLGDDFDDTLKRPFIHTPQTPPPRAPSWKRQLRRTSQSLENVRMSVSDKMRRSGVTFKRSQQERDADPAWLYILRGMAKGFLIYCLPISLLKRKITGLRRGLALSAFVGVIRAFDRFLAWMEKPNGPWSKTRLAEILRNQSISMPIHGVAGAIAALFAVQIDPTLLNSTVVFWCLVRAVRCLPLPNVPYGSTIVMCIAASQILTTWIVSPHHMPKGYIKFLNYHGQKNSPWDNEQVVMQQNFCHIVHPRRGHLNHTFWFFIKGFFQAWKVYIPIYLVFMIFSKHRSLSILLKNIFTSSTFLAAYCTAAFFSGCIFYETVWKISAIRNSWIFGGKISRAAFNCHLWAAGLATLIERPTRRPELAAYCMTFALESFYRYMIELGYIRDRVGYLLLLICAAVGVMLHHHDKQPPVAIHWLFGIK